MAPVTPSGPEQLLFELLVVFVTAKLLGELFQRVNLPAVPGEILAGIVLGPFALAWIPASDALRSIAQMGAIFILFSAGLETSPRDLIRVSRKALLVSVLGVIAPFVLGFGYMKLRGDNSTEAVFVAAAMVATSIAITARTLGDMNILSTRSARIILGAAVFDDILGMVVLAVVAGVASSAGVQWLHLGVLMGEAVAFALFMMFVAPRIVYRLHPKVEQLSTQNASLVVTLALCLALSWLASKIGMAAIVGSFFAGLMFADYAPRWNLVPRVGSITSFLAPFFFYDIGARFNVRTLTESLFGMAVVISFLAIVSKLMGCGLPLLREGWPMVFRVGIGMVPRGEVALIVALVGSQSKILSQQAYGIIVLMTVITTLISPPILRYLFRGEPRRDAGGNLASPLEL
jgi:Kef-type K+ transport system membrane component KefB